MLKNRLKLTFDVSGYSSALQTLFDTVPHVYFFFNKSLWFLHNYNFLYQWNKPIYRSLYRRKLKKGTQKRTSNFDEFISFLFFLHIFFSFFPILHPRIIRYVITNIKKTKLLKKKLQTWKYFFFINSFSLPHELFKISEKFEICKNINLVDLPEIKGQHRKFRTLVTSYIGKVWKSIFIPFFDKKKKHSKCLQFRAFFILFF